MWQLTRALNDEVTTGQKINFKEERNMLTGQNVASKFTDIWHIIYDMICTRIQNLFKKV